MSKRNIKKEIIFFQWGSANPKKDYAYVIMLDAIKHYGLKMNFGPAFLKESKWGEIHNKLCEKCKYLSRLFYGTYLWNIKLDRRREYIFLFNEWHPSIKNKDFIKWLKRRYKVKTVLVLRNMFQNKKYPKIQGRDLDSLKQDFNLIVTDEKQDAELYDLCFLPDPFSTPYKRKVETKYDICFIGADKGREDLLSTIAQKAKEKGVEFNFQIVGKKRKKNNLKYVDYMSYWNIIKQDMEANCILEILQPGQDSYTLRLQEAVCLGKKLLTNNPKVSQEKYYNPKYIQVFQNVDDIDWDFVKEKEEVKYKYKGEYSPITFIKMIEKILGENE